MTTVQNTAEGGTNGVAITTANVATITGGASGDPYQLVSVSGSVSFSTAAASRGALGYLFTPTSGAQSILRRTGFNDTQGVLRRRITISSLPTAQETVVAVASSTGAGIISIAISTAGKYVIQDSLGTIIGTVSTNSYAADDLIELSWQVGTTNSNGVFHWALTRTGSTSALETKTASNANLSNSGAITAWDRINYGKNTTSTWTATQYMDDEAAANGTQTLFGPPAALPTAAYTYTRAGLGLTVDGSGSTAVTPATIASYDWDWGDGSTHSSGATPAKHTYAVAGSYNVVLTVTDSAAGTNAFSNTITIEAPSSTVTVESIAVAAGWTASSGTALSCITDGDPTTFITSGSNPSALELDIILKALIPVATGQPLKVYLTTDAPLSTSAHVDAQLFEGVTQRSTVSGTVIPSGAGSSVGSTIAITFPYTDLTAVTTGGWNALKVKTQITAS